MTVEKKLAVALEGGRAACVYVPDDLSMTDIQLLAWQLGNLITEDTGGRVVRGNDGGGQRDFLDNRPIHCGTPLELLNVDGSVVDVCYEAAHFGPLPMKRPMMHFGDQEVPILPFHRFRWPARRAP